MTLAARQACICVHLRTRGRVHISAQSKHRCSQRLQFLGSSSPLSPCRKREVSNKRRVYETGWVIHTCTERERRSWPPSSSLGERARQEAERKAVPSWSWIPAKSLLVCSSGWSQRLTLLAGRAAVLLKHIWRSESPNSPHIVFLLSPDLALPSRNADKGFTHLLRVSPGSSPPLPRSTSPPSTLAVFAGACTVAQWDLFFFLPPFSFSLPPFSTHQPLNAATALQRCAPVPPTEPLVFLFSSCEVAVLIQ